jgi:hypothetical protein
MVFRAGLLAGSVYQAVKMATRLYRVALWQTDRSMLVEVWERLCGYHKWTPTTATVLSSALAGVGLSGTVEGELQSDKIVVSWESHCRIVWKDQQGAEHTAVFEVDEESPLYQLCDGDSVDIRFNPQKPDDYYLPGLLQARLVGAWKFGLFAATIVLVCIACVLAWFGPNLLFRTIFH